MKSLIAFDDDEYLPKIIGDKGPDVRKILEETLASILEFYGLYRTNQKFLEAIKKDTSLTEEFQKCILTCYSKPTKHLEELKQKIKSQQGHYSYCPYCGISTSDSFDHYLPKSHFPQYCIFPLNLIPICSDCNRRKGERYVKDGQRLFLNPYFDQELRT